MIRRYNTTDGSAKKEKHPEDLTIDLRDSILVAKLLGNSKLDSSTSEKG